MPNTVANLTFQNANDVAFRAWGSGFSAALATVGLVQTADTGQINWTTVLRPGTNNNDAGYEIWRFNDSLQSTNPVFIKFAYGVGNVSYGRIRIAISNATDGAGNLTGEVLNVAVLANVTDTVTEWWLSSDGSGLNIVPMATTLVANHRGSNIVIERFRNDDGTPNNRGMFLFIGPYSPVTAVTTTFNYANNAFETSNLPYLANIPVPASPLTTLIDDSYNAKTFPMMAANQQGITMSKMCVVHIGTDLPFGTTRNITHFGAARKYRPLSGSAATRATNGVAAAAQFSCCIWWED